MRKIFYKSMTLAACSLWLVTCAFAQDLHFSQFMNSPLLTNPVNTGFIPQADYRLGINYRYQWSSIMSVAYKTMSSFGVFQVMTNMIELCLICLGREMLNREQVCEYR